jgi:hypothetical protein
MKGKWCPAWPGTRSNAVRLRASRRVARRAASSMAEQQALNLQCQGSSPWWRTIAGSANWQAAGSWTPQCGFKSCPGSAAVAHGLRPRPRKASDPGRHRTAAPRSYSSGREARPRSWTAQVQVLPSARSVLRSSAGTELHAVVAQRLEHFLAKEEVARSIRVSRSHAELAQLARGAPFRAERFPVRIRSSVRRGGLVKSSIRHGE